MKTSNRIKEEERIEGIIRGLMKRPENRTCINCNSLGPQYVCTTFLTFVCTNCSGVHREFTHRVKSISMAKFSAEEVSALQAAGNERARQIYLKGWDPHRNSYPDGSNLRKLRDFIKHVYVDRKYTGENSGTLPRLRLGENEDAYESGWKVSRYRIESKSPRYEIRYELSSSERSHSGRRSNDRNSGYLSDDRSPRYNPENSRFGGYQKSPVRIEIVDNRFRDVTSPSGRQTGSRNFTNGDERSGSGSPDSQTIKNSSNALGPRSKATDGKDPEGSANSQKIALSRDLLSDANPEENAPSSSLVPVDGNPVEHHKKNSESLINFSEDPEPPDASLAAPQTQQITPSDPGNQPSNEPSSKETTKTSPMPNTLEFLIFELSAPLAAQNNDDAPSTVSASNIPEGGVSSVVPSMGDLLASAPASTTNMALQPYGISVASSAFPLGQMSTVPSSFGASPTASTANMLVHPSEGNMAVSGVSPAPPSEKMALVSVSDSLTASSNSTVPVAPLLAGSPQAAPDINVEPTLKVPDGQQLSSMQLYQPMPSSDTDNRSSAQQTATPVEDVNNQLSLSALVPYSQGPSGDSAEQSSETVSRAVQDTTSKVGSKLVHVESKSTGRKELPADLFTASYGPAPVPHWQTVNTHSMGYGMQQYSNPMIMPVYPIQSRSTNPFDVHSETAQTQVPAFPSMASLQGSLPNAGLLHTSNAGAHSLGLMLPQSSSYASAVHPKSSSFSSNMSPSAFMGQQVHTNMASSRLFDMNEHSEHERRQR
ncbi:probable ADP-ribosylation factor GTPase-activating protein AGD14 [Mangifera indica]|uniref:probable ADP-ribosylation factor GTPase-activating protein AGD14 n=1 Tax=Mangifera indica TaxID=29780 RepID=UPI001CF9992F|nr:probable ADP-ribosylation factor GTPase-activating protein AGD14 [Mangifera indica]